MKTPSPINLENLQRSTWSQQERESAQLVVDFVEQLMNQHAFDYVLEKYGQGSYIQHNRSMANGIPGVVAAVKALTKRFPEFSYAVKNIYVDDDRVTLHTHATMRAKDRGNEKKGFIIFDTWKVVDGKLVEHWDALQPLDWGMRLFNLFSGGSIKNENGLF